MRGEYLPIQIKNIDFSRTTSACAENTSAAMTATKARRNYLRVRGEYAAIAKPNATKGELPPRARRIRFAHEVAGFV